MNRAQRRQMSKKLGIMEYQNSLPRDKKYNLMRENILAGKQRELEVKEETRIKEEEQLAEKESKALESLAKIISQTKKISLVEAINEAKIQRHKK